MSTPTFEAISLVEATMPCLARTGSREAAWAVVEAMERRSDAISVKATEAAGIDLAVWLRFLFLMAVFSELPDAALPFSYA
jgi:hypothetical protein